MTTITNEVFLSNLFGEELDNAFTCDHWFKYKHYSKLSKDEPQYYAICSVNKHSRKNENFKALHVLVCDDVGTKAKIPELKPTYIIETSPNNFQFGYKLASPEQDISKANALIAELVTSGYSDPEARGIVRLVRLPGGINGKKDDAKKTTFHVRLVELHPDITYTYDELYKEFSNQQSDQQQSQQDQYTTFEIPDNIPNGQRNSVLTRICGYLVGRGMDIADVTSAMHTYNQTLCEEPLPIDEIENIIKSIYTRHKSKYQVYIDNIYHVKETNTWYDFATRIEMVGPSLDITYQKEFPGTKKTRPKITRWLPSQKGFNQVDNFTWSPVPYQQETSILSFDGKRLINTWRGFPIEPAPGDVQPWLDHLAHLIPEEDYREALLWWIAFNIQRPDVKCNWQPIILGRSGAGKDALFRPIAQILGNAYKVIGNQDIKGDYHDGLYQTKILHISEASGLSGRAVDFYKRITAIESSGMQILNIKCHGQIMQPSLYNVVVITNNIDAMKFSHDERRAFVLRSPNVMTPVQQHAYFNEWLEKGGATHLFDYLLKYDLSRFKPGIRPYRTNHFEELLSVTRSDNEIDIEEIVSEYDICLPETIRSILNMDDKYATARIIVWLDNNDWVRWDGGDQGRRIKRKIDGKTCAPKSRNWYVRKGSRFYNCSPTEMCLEVERVEKELVKKTKF